MSDHERPDPDDQRLDDLLADVFAAEVPAGLAAKVADLGGWVDPDAVVAGWVIETAAVRAADSELLRCAWDDGTVELAATLTRGVDRSDLSVVLTVDYHLDGDEAASIEFDVFDRHRQRVPLNHGVARLVLEEPSPPFRFVVTVGAARYLTDWIR
jgi:hypothetical protein